MFLATFPFLILGATFANSHFYSPNVPYKLPLHTGNGTDILSSDGQVVKYLGTNWAAHQEPMIPEGLQYSSIQDIVSKIKGFSLNSVRLTFAIEMIDDILDNGGDVSLETTLITALGVENGTLILNQVLSHNPQFTKETTRLEIFDETARELGKQGILLHLDNHMSVAKWCCGAADGNAWFGDSDFDVEKWMRGWSFMASHVSNVSVSFLRILAYFLITDSLFRLHAIGPLSPLLASAMNFASQMAPVNQSIGIPGTNT